MGKPMARLNGLVVIEGKTFKDDRGYFRETFRVSGLEALIGRPCEFVQDNESCSRKGVLRGLHFQRPPHAQAKLVRVVHGRIFDVAVDLRSDSTTFGRWVGYELNAENGRQLFIPEGFAHGFLALEDGTVVCYKASDYYAPECEGGIRWDDPDVGVEWPIGDKPIVSGRDAVLPNFAMAWRYDGLIACPSNSVTNASPSHEYLFAGIGKQL